MTRFQVLALLSALCSFQADAVSLRSMAENPFLSAHRQLLSPIPPSCPNTEKVDYVGNDIKSVSSVPVADCCYLCSQTNNCGAFTWTSYQGGTCWLKSAKGYTKSDPAATSAVLIPSPPLCTLNDAVDYQGNDIANVRRGNAGTCCEVCMMWRGCNAFSWSDHEGGTCWLKSKKGAEVYKAGVKSASVTNLVVGDCALETNVDYVNSDIGNVLAGKPEDCCDKCRAKVGCHAFSWSNHQGGTCWLKSGKSGTAATNGVTSAVVS